MSNKLSLFILTNIYIYSLLYIYIEFAYPKYSYLGWQLNLDLNYFYIFITALFTSAVGLFIKRKIEGPLEILVVLSYLIIYIPSLNLALVSIERNNHIFTLFSSYTISIFILIILSYVNFKVLRFKYLDKRYFNNFIFTLTVIIFLLVIVSYKPNISNIYKILDFSDVYDLREGYREANKSIPLLINYFFTWSVKVFVPLIFILGLVNRSLKLKWISFLMIFILFLVSGHKSIILGFGLILLLNLSFKNRDYDVLNLMKGLYCIVFFSTFLAILNFPVLQELIVRRAILVPGMLSNFYFDFFSKNEFAMLGYSILSFIVDYPYDRTPPFLIGDYYFNRIEMSANANYMAAAYADFGAIGTIVTTFICGIYFKLINMIVARKNIVKLSCFISIVPMWALFDSSLITVLVTHGLLWVFIILYFIPKDYLDDKYN